MAVGDCQLFLVYQYQSRFVYCSSKCEQIHNCKFIYHCYFRDKCKKVADIFVKKGPFLKLYTPYFKDFESSRAVLEDACERFPDFANTLAEFEVSIAHGHHYCNLRNNW